MSNKGNDKNKPSEEELDKKMKGCHTQGDSLDEVPANMKEAVDLYIERNSTKS